MNVLDSARGRTRQSARIAICLSKKDARHDISHVDAAQIQSVRKLDSLYQAQAYSIPESEIDMSSCDRELNSPTPRYSQKLSRSSGHQLGPEKDKTFLSTGDLNSLDKEERNALAQLLLHPSEQPYSLEYVHELCRTAIDLIDESMERFALEFDLSNIYWAGLVDDEEVFKLSADIFGTRSKVKMAAYGYKLCQKRDIRPENILRAFVANALTAWLLRDFNDAEWSKENPRSRAMEQTIARGILTFWPLFWESAD